MKNEAFISDCGRYRWWLRRRKESFLDFKTLIFVGLNPSLANAYREDQTLRRIWSFCNQWNYQELWIVNLFGLISASPKNLRKTYNPIGDFNDKELSLKVRNWSRSSKWDLMFGWGVGGGFLNRNIEIMNLLQNHFQERENNFPHASGPLSIGITKNGQPRHPLYSSREQVLRPVKWNGDKFTFDE